VSIRLKVILPYLVLTLLVAVTGVYVVTRLVANSLSERFTNQLLEAGRVVSDGFARQEIRHVEVARLVAYTEGVATAIEQDDTATLATLVRPLAAGLAAENLVVINRQGQELLHVIIQPDGSLEDVAGPGALGSQPIVRKLLDANDPQSPPGRAILQNPADSRSYYYTALPVSLNGQVIGVIVVGNSLNTLLPYLKSISLADVTIYDENGQVSASTLAADNPAALALDAEDYTQALGVISATQQKQVNLGGRGYSLAVGSLQISVDTVAVYSVALPSDYVISPGSASRNTYIVLFGIAMVAVVVIGIFISQPIIQPLFSLVRTSQSIAQGNLDQRSGIKSKDEIGTLASTFDEMTSRLQQRTEELEKTYHILEQMDRTKSSFIDVSAHELRSPLTSVKGYAQMMQLKVKDNPDLNALTNGLIDGVNRMAEIVNNMLDVTRIDANALKLVPDNVQIAAIMMRVERTFQKSLQERNLTLKTDGLADLPTLYVDPDLIYKVFYHLVMNAIKYTPDGGAIRVYGQVLRGNAQIPEMEIVVEDSGVGVAIEHREAIFEKFFQTGEVMFHSSGKTKFKGGGPGLGLAIARGIINAHNGRIWVDSPGHDDETCPGSKFIVHLPMTEARI